MWKENLAWYFFKKLYFLFQISFQKHVPPWQKSKTEMTASFEMDQLQQAQVCGFAQIVPQTFFAS